MREVRTEAIVLQSRTLGEDDLLVDFFTPDEGRFYGVARHGRKSKKRFGTILEPFNTIEVRFKDGGGAFVFLEEASLPKPLLRLDESLARLSAAFYLVDLIRESIPQRSHDSQLYESFKHAIFELEDLKPVAPILIEFEQRLLELTGYGLDLEKCMTCGREWDRAEKFHFVFREGGIFCKTCLPQGTPHVFYSPTSLSSLIPEFIEYQLGRSLRSRRFLNLLGVF